MWLGSFQFLEWVTWQPENEITQDCDKDEDKDENYKPSNQIVRHIHQAFLYQLTQMGQKTHLCSNCIT
jgi:hypothetical protein